MNNFLNMEQGQHYQEADTMAPIRFTIIDTNDTVPMYTRPYEAMASGNAMQGMGALVNSNLAITPATVAQYAGQLMLPSGVAENVVDIPNGWTTKRIRFVMEFQIQSGIDVLFQVVTGYTDYNDPSYSGILDPRMRFHFNNVVLLRQTQRVNNFGQMEYGKAICNASQLLSVHDGQARFNVYESPQLKQSMTPASVFAAVELMANPVANGGAVYDTRTPVGSGPGVTASNRRNNHSATYLTDTLTSIQNVVTHNLTQSTGSLHIPESTLYSQARSAAQMKELNPLLDSFMSLIMARTDFQHTGSVAWGDLQKLFPTLDGICQGIKQGGIMEIRSTIPEFGMGDISDWKGSNLENQMATVLINTIPSLMTDCLLSDVAFVSHNQTHNGQTVSGVNHSRTLLGDNVDCTYLVNAFIQRLETEIIPIISVGGKRDYNVAMSCEISGETQLTLSIAGMKVVSYMAPSYCDNLYTPVMTYNQNRLGMLATDIKKVTDHFTSFVL